MTENPDRKNQAKNRHQQGTLAKETPHNHMPDVQRPLVPGQLLTGYRPPAPPLNPGRQQANGQHQQGPAVPPLIQLNIGTEGAHPADSSTYQVGQGLPGRYQGPYQGVSFLWGALAGSAPSGPALGRRPALTSGLALAASCCLLSHSSLSVTSV